MGCNEAFIFTMMMKSTNSISGNFIFQLTWMYFFDFVWFGLVWSLLCIMVCISGTLRHGDVAFNFWKIIYSNFVHASSNQPKIKRKVFLLQRIEYWFLNVKLKWNEHFRWNDLWKTITNLHQFVWNLNAFSLQIVYSIGCVPQKHSFWSSNLVRIHIRI